MFRLRLFLCALASLVGAATVRASDAAWQVVQVGTELRISYGTGAGSPQFAAVHLDSSYFRLVPSTAAGWGTSVVLMPPLWSGGRYFQGAPVTCAWSQNNADLVLTIAGSVATLQISTVVRLSPPHDGFFVADVSSTATGAVSLDARPGEAFKPVMLSSMHESATIWDAREAYVAGAAIALPSSGWILPQPRSSRTLGLRGGDSTWKPGAPTIEVNLLAPADLAVTGWVTASQDPNDDNVAFWAASDTVLSAWHYQLVAKTAANDALTPPVFATSPASLSTPPGPSVAFTATALGTPAPSLAWESSADRGVTWSPLGDDVTFSGTAADTLHVTATSALDSTRYRCVARNAAGAVTSAAALLTVNAAPARLVNLSARAFCGTGDRVAICGFVIAGSSPKRVLARAVGPTLARYDIPAAEILADPAMDLHHGDDVIATNDNWTDGPAAEISSVGAQLGAAPLAADDTTSAALLLTLAPGIYTFVVHGHGDATGIVLLELYDADPPGGSTLVNLSARVFGTTGNGVAIGGIVVGDGAPKHVLLRAIGPTLANAGLAPAELLADPVIALHRGDAILATNDNYVDGVDAAAIATIGARLGAAPIDAADTRSSALLLTLTPGPCTFIASGNTNTSGIVLIEVYDAD